MAEEWDSKALAVAIRVIPMLHGLPLNQAQYALRLAGMLLLETNKVDAYSAELKAKAIEEGCDGNE